MPTKRQVLDLLTRDELSALVDRHGVIVGSRRGKPHLVERLDEKAPALPELLGGMPRDRLKELCRAFGLDDGGREKALRERLASAPTEPSIPAAPVKPGTTSAANGTARAKRGRKPVRAEQANLPIVATDPSTGAPAVKPGASKANGAARAKRGRKPAHAEQLDWLMAANKLTPEVLQRHLWSAADILRGSIDSSDYKNYIFGLVFLKRLSDRFDEEYKALVDEHRDPEDRDEHQFYVPEKARWAALRKIPTGVGEALNTACSALEEENGSLEGVLEGIDFNDERKLGDMKSRDGVLARLVQHFSKLDLRNAKLSEPDMLGNAYEYLIEKFADDAGKKGGEFRTPQKVVELVVELLAPQEGMRICDPTCGSGGMLLGCVQYVRRHGGDSQNLGLFGQEKNLGTWAICKMNMLLHGRPDDRIEKGDTIREPKLLEKDGTLMPFDRVLANPPFSLDQWGHDVAAVDGYHRFSYGVPPRTKGDMAFLQHMIATLNDKGMVGVVMPHGVLFRGAVEGEIRKGLLKAGLFEAVIGLPQNLFFGTTIPAAILVLNRAKNRNKKDKVLFIDASQGFGEGTARNFLRDQDIKRIVSTFREYENTERYARAVTLAEIEKNDFNLTISRYVDIAEREQKIDLDAAFAKLRQVREERDEAETTMIAHLRELGCDP